MKINGWIIFLALIILIILIINYFKNIKSNKPGNIKNRVFGINIGNTFESFFQQNNNRQCSKLAWSGLNTDYFKKDYITNSIKRFSIIRLPVKWTPKEGPVNNKTGCSYFYYKNENNFGLTTYGQNFVKNILSKYIQTCINNNTYLIINVHHANWVTCLNGKFQFNQDNQNKFSALWNTICRELKKLNIDNLETYVWLEVFNEPNECTFNSNGKDIYTLNKIGYDAIRNNFKNIWILLGGGRWNFESLWMDECSLYCNNIFYSWLDSIKKDNIMITIHFYNNTGFTGPGGTCKLNYKSKIEGESCTQHFECNSGVCKGGICCSKNVQANCGKCNDQSNKYPGMCNQCLDGYTMDKNNNCVRNGKLKNNLEIGDKCKINSDCNSGICLGGVCCNQNVQTNCKKCNDKSSKYPGMCNQCNNNYKFNPNNNCIPNTYISDIYTTDTPVGDMVGKNNSALIKISDIMNRLGLPWVITESGCNLCEVDNNGLPVNIDDKKMYLQNLVKNSLDLQNLVGLVLWNDGGNFNYFDFNSSDFSNSKIEFLNDIVYKK